MPRNAVTYDEDFFAWTEEQARLLRAGEFSTARCENLAEEMEEHGPAASGASCAIGWPC